MGSFCSLRQPQHWFITLCKLCLQGVKLTEKERRDLEYKEQVYRLAVERKKQLGELPAEVRPLKHLLFVISKLH